jgi:phosphoglycolate phosphatase-like HAD superfamily hydrolase
MLAEEKPLGIVTSLPGRIFEPLLESLDLTKHFKTVIHPGNCRQLKPNPAPIL